MDRRRAFVLVAAVVLSLVFLWLVIGPAVERGGVQELLIIVLIFVGILLVERYVRTRA